MSDRDPPTTSGRRRFPAGEIREAPGGSTEPVDYSKEKLAGRGARPRVASRNRSTSKKDRELEHYLDGYTIRRESHTPFNTSGGFCDVFIGRHPIYLKVVMKRPRMALHGAGESHIKHFRTEAKIWSMLRHPNILHFIGMIEADDHVWLISPFAANGSLPDYIKAHPGTDRVKLVLQLIHAIEYLHRQKVVHGDIKGANILISENVDVLLCDFGLSKFQDMKTATSLKGAGSNYWSAPELLFDDDPIKTYASDVYASGVTVYQILSGNIPFNACPITALVVAISSNERPPKEPETSPSGASYEVLWEIAEACWAAEPSERPGMEDVQAHFRAGVDSDGYSSLSEADPSDHDSSHVIESQDRTVRALNTLVAHARPETTVRPKNVQKKVASTDSTELRAQTVRAPNTPAAPARRGTTVLSEDEKEKVKAACPKATTKILTATPARIYYAYPDPNRWSYSGQEGAIALVVDKIKGSCYFRMIDQRALEESPGSTNFMKVSPTTKIDRFSTHLQEMNA